jgi:hypothetical protein
VHAECIASDHGGLCGPRFAARAGRTSPSRCACVEVRPEKKRAGRQLCSSSDCRCGSSCRTHGRRHRCQSSRTPVARPEMAQEPVLIRDPPPMPDPMQPQQVRRFQVTAFSWVSPFTHACQAVVTKSPRPSSLIKLRYLTLLYVAYGAWRAMVSRL